MEHLLKGSACFLVCILVVSIAVAGTADPGRVVPSPQYIEPAKESLRIGAGGSVTIVVGPASAMSNPKLRLAVEFLREKVVTMDQSIKVIVPPVVEDRGSTPCICVWDYSAGDNTPVALNFLDRQTLSTSNHYGQSYVIKAPDLNSLWVIGSSDQGALLGTMTLLQLINKVRSGLEVKRVYIRDYPDFEFRAASDWLLNVEINRWALDRGQGIDAFARLCEQKLDRALRFKINMVRIDGFGWGLNQRFKGYPELMRRLNRYARARGIHLDYGGYGASYGIAYQGGPLYEDAPYLGKIFENRERYPDGPTYQCMGYTHGDKGVDPSVLGSCRANEELNGQKAEELRQFVEAVEPGALYIHHEDYGDFQGTEAFWKKRCSRCRNRWPNDSLVAKDGGAGGFANGYSALAQAVNSVKNPASGYDASRDCQIILISPVYVPDSEKSEHWAEVLELWQNIALQLPKVQNLQVGLREIFPQRHGGTKFTQEFKFAMEHVGLSIGSFLFYAGGADNFRSDYPLTGAPALNAMFLGARTIYNSTGDFYREPMEIIAAEYSWNAHSPGFRDPLSYDEALRLDRRYTFKSGEPEQVFGSEGVYAKACELLYGPKAGAIMASYYRESAWLPDIEIPGSKLEPTFHSESYLPGTWNQIYALPSHWRHLALDSKTWGPELNNEAYNRDFKRLKIDRKELHRRLARRWQMVSQLNTKGADYIKRALGADPTVESAEDLRFLMNLFQVCQPLSESLAEFHAALHLRFSEQPEGDKIKAGLESALIKAQRARQLAEQAFPRPIDPAGGEVGTLRNELNHLVESIIATQKKS